MNNKGFAVSTALYGLLMVFIIVLMLIFQTVKTMNTNNKSVASNIQKKLTDCEEYRKKYNMCNNDIECNVYFNINKLCMEYGSKKFKNGDNYIDDYNNYVNCINDGRCDAKKESFEAALKS